eukprot:SAG11_NODE_324_length_10739_cov_86.975752_9_plen_60_part_00
MSLAAGALDVARDTKLEAYFKAVADRVPVMLAGRETVAAEVPYEAMPRCVCVCVCVCVW